ncbi:MAG: single-stranded DNA-binding protein [Acidimicrobiaceae bacterium]|nr:single-stranded DNA-binding protein [Acidimicrobiaceae bacterium]
MNNITFVGNLTADPRLVVGQGEGKARATFSVAVNEGQGDRERTHFVNVTAWGTLGENVADSLTKGMRVVVVGRINTYPREVIIDGKDKSLTMMSVVATAVGLDLRWVHAKVTKFVRDSGNDGSEGGETQIEFPALAPGPLDSVHTRSWCRKLNQHVHFIPKILDLVMVLHHLGGFLQFHHLLPHGLW